MSNYGETADSVVWEERLILLGELPAWIHKKRIVQLESARQKKQNKSYYVVSSCTAGSYKVSLE